MKRMYAVAIGAAVPLAVLAGCAPTATDTAQDADAPITVWVDDTRAEPAQAYADAHPGLNAKIETIDNAQGAVSSRIALATKAGEGVPDVVFLSSPDEISVLLANPVNYPLALNDVVDKSVLDGFADGTVARCTVDGKAYCLPNDIAQTVLYYNKTLFDQFGYTVPTTFADFLALGESLAQDHPGYSLGSISGRYGLNGYYGSSGCKYQDSSSPTDVVINVEADSCTRVSAVIGPLAANGTLSTLDPFDKSFTPLVTGGKLLATVSPSWMGEYGIKPNYAQEGEWAVAAMPTWDGADKNYSGAVGGGIWLVSATSANKEAAAKFAVGVTTDTGIAGAGSGYPADKKSADVWLKALSEDPWYAEDPSEELRAAADLITPTAGYVRYTTQALDIFNSTVVVKAATDIDGALKDFGTQVAQAAEAVGYTVAPK